MGWDLLAALANAVMLAAAVLLFDHRPLHGLPGAIRAIVLVALLTIFDLWAVGRRTRQDRRTRARTAVIAGIGVLLIVPIGVWYSARHGESTPAWCIALITVVAAVALVGGATVLRSTLRATVPN